LRSTRNLSLDLSYPNPNGGNNHVQPVSGYLGYSSAVIRDVVRERERILRDEIERLRALLRNVRDLTERI
jgi:hypothetical protein